MARCGRPAGGPGTQDTCGQHADRVSLRIPYPLGGRRGLPGMAVANYAQVIPTTLGAQVHVGKHIHTARRPGPLPAASHAEPPCSQPQASLCPLSAQLSASQGTSCDRPGPLSLAQCTQQNVFQVQPCRSPCGMTFLCKLLSILHTRIPLQVPFSW